MKRTKKNLFFLLAFFMIGAGWLLWKSQFRIDSITVDSSFYTGYNLVGLTQQEKEKLLSLTKQPFYYLSQGNQSFVFESKDGEYVLKFFKFKQIKDYPNRSQEWLNKKNRRNFIGYSLGFEKDRQNSALFYVHLAPTNFIQQNVEIFDRLGFKHIIELDTTVFILQRKGRVARDCISKLLREGHIEMAKQYFHNMLVMYRDMHQKGLYDRDHNVMYNTGFIGDMPFRIDLGKLKADEKMQELQNSRADLEKIGLKRIDKWLNNHFPQYREEIISDIAQVIENLYL